MTGLHWLPLPGGFLTGSMKQSTVLAETFDGNTETSTVCVVELIVALKLEPTALRLSQPSLLTPASLRAFSVSWSSLKRRMSRTCPPE